MKDLKIYVRSIFLKIIQKPNCQLKQQSKMQGPLSLKNKTLSTPLLSKTSTPIRSRLISAKAPLNSTPINQLKMTSTPITDKQNHNTSNITYDQRRPLQSLKQNYDLTQSNIFSKNICFGDYKFSKKVIHETNGDNIIEKLTPNLSPIFALNKKINQLPQSSSITSNTFRSLTPNNNKFSDSIRDLSQQKPHKIQITTFSSLASPGTQTVKHATSKNKLHSSSSFSNLFEKRNKTPTRLGSMVFGSFSRKNNPSPNIKPLNQSKMQQLKFLSQREQQKSQKQLQIPNKQTLNQSSYSNSLSDNSKPMCMNNHGKTAKYRVKPSSEEEDKPHLKEIQSWIYCSKCAIDLVQKGFLVEELIYAPQTQNMSLHTSPRQQPLRESQLLKNNFLSFRTSYNSELLQKLKRAQKLKMLLINEISVREQRKQIISKKFHNQREEIDCYYNSIISYIEHQRARDRESLQQLKQKVEQQILSQDKEQSEYQDQKLQNYLTTIQQLLKSKKNDSQTLNYIEEVERQLQKTLTRYKNIPKQYTEILSDQTKTIIHFPSPIQQQFDSFVSYFDAEAKLNYKTFQQLSLPKNNALRFSFEKALLNQNHKKSLAMPTPLMSSLQQESYQEYDENSFSHEHMMQTAQSRQYYQQNPFRTLFAEEDDILQDDEKEEDKGKNDMYSPTFKFI